MTDLQDMATFFHIECYSDPENHLLAMDVVYFGSKLKPENENMSSQDGIIEYWPTPEEYSAGITKEDWINLLRDSEITTLENLAMFKGMLEIGGESTCVHLADVYGKTYNFNNYKNQGLIEMTTFHQSYGYEEFIEGIRPVMESGEEETGDVRYRIEPGIFRKFCDNAINYYPFRRSRV